jgi:hypothetical protein
MVDIGMDVSSEKHVGDGLGQDLEVEPERLAVDIFDIQSLAAIPGNVAPAADLSESGNAGLDVQLSFLRFGVIAKLVHLVGPRADQTHVGPEDVEELWEFIEASLSEEASHPGNPRVVTTGIG